jgi:hypothetical protein
MPATAVKLTKPELQGAMLSVLGLASLFARMTATQLDDNAVTLLTGVVTDPARFNDLYNLLYPTPVVPPVV